MKPVPRDECEISLKIRGMYSGYNSILFGGFHVESLKQIVSPVRCKDMFAQNIQYKFGKFLRKNVGISFAIIEHNMPEKHRDEIVARAELFIKMVNAIEANWGKVRKSRLINITYDEKIVGVFIHPSYVWFYGVPITSMFVLMFRILMSGLDKSSKKIKVPDKIEKRQEIQQILRPFANHSDSWFCSIKSKKIGDIITKAHIIWEKAKSDRMQYIGKVSSYYGIKEFTGSRPSHNKFTETYRKRRKA